MKRTPLNRGNKQLKRSGSLKRGSSLKRSRIKPKSANQIQVDDEYARYRKKVAAIKGMVCWGCGATENQKPLTFSHLIARSSRPDLITHVPNIHIHCTDWMGEVGCHEKHESQQWGGMLDGDLIQKKMKEMDMEYYLRVTTL